MKWGVRREERRADKAAIANSKSAQKSTDEKIAALERAASRSDSSALSKELQENDAEVNRQIGLVEDMFSSKAEKNGDVNVLSDADYDQYEYMISGVINKGTAKNQAAIESSPQYKEALAAIKNAEKLEFDARPALERRFERRARAVGMSISAAALAALNALEHSEDVESEDLIHYGVKGMKWGVHRSPTTKREGAAYIRSVEKLNSTGLKKLNKDPRFKDQEIDPRTKLGKEYQKAAEDLFDDVFRTKMRNSTIRNLATKGTITVVSLATGAAIVGVAANIALSAAGIGKTTEKQQAKIDQARSGELEHSDDDFTPLKFKLKLNDLGQIESIYDVEEVTMSNDAELKHHGIKGMKWGIRRSPAQLQAAAKQSGDSSTGTAAKKDSVVGETSQQKYDRLKAKAQSEGGKSLTTEELNFFNSRTEAIKKVDKMFAKDDWFKQMLKDVGRQTLKQQTQALATKAATNVADGLIKKAAAKKAAEEATKAATKVAVKKLPLKS